MKKLKIFAFLLTLILTVSTFFAFSTAFADEQRQEVYLGGKTIGIDMNSNGVLITGTTHVICDDGIVEPIKNKNVKSGDVILSINGYPTNCVKDVKFALQNLSDNTAILHLKRGNLEFDCEIEACVDYLTEEKRLGILVSEGVSGVGTLTFVMSNNNFGGLGHKIIDSYGRNSLSIGSLFDCKVVGINKGVKGRPGELLGLFNKDGEETGVIAKNSESGIFGKITDENYVSDMQKVRLGNLSEVETGKAYIFCSLSDDIVRRFEISIEKIDYNGNNQGKNFLIKITDQRLLDLTGGIVQGMSGSPIVQNGYLIGAVTHVLVNNPTMGYGIYIENMINEVK